MKFRNSIRNFNSSLMKLKQFFTLAAATFFFGAIAANAQTSSLNAASGPFDNLAHDCVSKTQSGSQVLLLNHNDIVTQSFTACTKGEVRMIYVMVKQASGDGQLLFYIEDERGELISKSNLVVRDGFSGVATSTHSRSHNHSETAPSIWSRSSKASSPPRKYRHCISNPF